MPKMIHQCYSLNYLQYVTVNMQRKPRVGKSGAVAVFFHFISWKFRVVFNQIVFETSKATATAA